MTRLVPSLLQLSYHTLSGPPTAIASLAAEPAVLRHWLYYEVQNLLPRAAMKSLCLSSSAGQMLR